MKKDFLYVQSILVENYLNGKRDNSKICSTKKIVKQLEEKYKIKMKKVETVNKGLGLYMFEIEKK